VVAGVSVRRLVRAWTLRATDSVTRLLAHLHESRERLVRMACAAGW